MFDVLVLNVVFLYKLVSNVFNVKCWCFCWIVLVFIVVKLDSCWICRFRSLFFFLVCFNKGVMLVLVFFFFNKVSVICNWVSGVCNLWEILVFWCFWFWISLVMCVVMLLNWVNNLVNCVLVVYWWLGLVGDFVLILCWSCFCFMVLNVWLSWVKGLVIECINN